MLYCLKRVSNYSIAFIAFLIFAFPTICGAQSLGDPIVNITFGSGTDRYAGPLAPDSGSTTYTYFQNIGNPGQNFPQDGQYTIVNTSTGMLSNLWVSTTDHTGNPGGYFMLVNAANTPGLFYTRKVTALCAGTKYQFGAFVKNMFNNGAGNPPNVTFQIETEAGQVLNSYVTGNIAADGQWNPYTTEFTTPANTGVIVLKMINNGPGGYGNDLAIDDITFRPYGDPVQVVFDQTSATQVCAGNPQTIVIKSVIPPSSGYSQKIQQRVNGAWADITANISGSTYRFLSPTIAGTYRYRVVSGLSANIGNSQCVVASNELVVTVLPLPDVSFISPVAACQAEPIAFKDNSQPNGATITNWLWNFGDGQTSTLQNPVHSYAAAGNYSVTLTITCNNGCPVAPLTKQVKINELPQAAFSLLTPACVNQPVTLIDGSIVPTGATVTARAWDINGIIVNRTDAQPFNYVFPSTGVYNIKLTITLSTGCTAQIIKQVTVHPLPVVDFDTPPTCVSDNAIFTNHTSIADNSALSYLWDFGDNTPKSNQKSPSHKYQNTGDYVITLTVISASGCSEVVSKPFKVNGSTPRADFTVLNSDKLYSNTEVVIKNNSSVDVFGDVTKIELYYDYLNNASLVEVDDNPVPGKLYRHVYPEFHTGTRQYTIRMLAYSGSVCVSQQKTDVITVLATPLIAFTQPAPVCQNETAVQLIAGDVSNSGFAGAGTYSGTGVSTTGLFDPAVSGPGTFTIKYTYTFTSTGASNSLSRDITVNSVPTLNLPPEITILEGGSGVLKAEATGSGLAYSWSPAIGLNNPNIANPTVAIGDNAIYKVTVTNSSGCIKTAEINVIVLKQPSVPNTFTPNGDGINDIWEIKYLNTYPGCTVNVFNRAGQKVYSSVGYAQPWDGKTGGSELGMGVYYYIIDPKNGRRPFSGSITIVK